MSLGRGGDDAWMVAPVPHGAAFDPDHPGIVACAPGTRVEVAALARFQQMALLGLDRLPVGVELDGAVVLGSGPVAVGCALELHRRGARPIHVCTARRKAAIEGVPGTRIEAQSGVAHLVIDAAGDPQRAVSMLAAGGVLGLLGTPEEAATIAAAQAHRQGWTVVGMHELADHHPGRYQDAYATVAGWLAAELDSGLVAAWCRTVPGHRAPEVFASLAEPERRLPEPVILFDWSCDA
ncbi:hypothetical protein RIF23_16065 [Lipingzhangella sp. LS1_29]|uniref:Zinc-binding dehydrogenase n=1 Tax=Lipingzhangella rawalii TaxID=2055835 RepID=A0ABU2HAB2_9ACTN|nr:hypothetical protein [Lipingzhangella rawalii]MDS1271809.1 hypothetical protein [Lipingzhangella rawalii]